ncbi:hypothetical protein C0971_07430 [Bacillus methanolicus]|nr:hypothetical protein C0971_07430 [Bacillus methanolicus]
MKKYYCDRCRRLYNEKEICTPCGLLASNSIWIEVQKQSERNQSFDTEGSFSYLACRQNR